MNRAGLGRADLIRCWDGLERGRFERVAVELGYRPRPKIVRVDLHEGIRVAAGIEFHAEMAFSVSAAPRQRYYRLTERQALASPFAPAPEPVPRASPAGEAEAPVPPLPPSPPLISWSRLWPFLRAALGEQADRRRIDLRRTVAAVARQRPLRRLPRLRGQRWAAQGQLILDLSDRLYPFWDDFNRLRDLLPGLRGDAGLEVLRMSHGPTGPVQTWTGSAWGRAHGYQAPAADVPILIAGDLGALGGEVEQQAWLGFGRRLVGRRRLPVALTPCPSRWWRRELDGLFFPVTLDRDARLPPRPTGPRPRQDIDSDQAVAADPGALTLLTLLSACIAITPALLRHLRHRLPAGLADVGSEAAAWCHPAVRTGDFALLPGDAKAIEVLREGFAGMEPEYQALAWSLIRAQQRLGVAKSACMDERLLYAALRGRGDDEAEAFLRRVEAAQGQADARSARTLDAWVGQRSARMHPTAWQYSPRSEALWLRSYRPEPGAEVIIPPGLDWDRAEAALGSEEHPQAWTLVQRGERLVFDLDPLPTTDLFNGSPITTLSTRRPSVGLRDPSGREQETVLTLTPGAGLALTEDRTILSTDSDRLTIEALTRPDWARAIGCDGDGLFVDFDDGRGERRAYWWSPGLVSSADDWHWSREPPALDHGFWLDQADYRVWRERGFEVPSWAGFFGRDSIGVWAAFNVGDVTQRLRWVWPGEYTIGSPKDELDRYDDETQHRVILTRGYWLAETACTQALWQAVMGDQPSGYRGMDRPVEQVSWNDVQRFIQRLNQQAPGLEARLPTEAEWEIACRAGTHTAFSFGQEIDPEQVNYQAKHNGPVDVGSLPPNSWGLFEMHGNVWEWCQDWLGGYPAGPAVDPTGPAAGADRVLRGGGWFYSAGLARSAFRDWGQPAGANTSTGLRLARGPEHQQDRQDRQEQRGTSGGGESAQGASGASGRRGRSGSAWSRFMRRIKR